MFEKKNGKRFLASIMAVVMLLSLAPVSALATDEDQQENTAVTQPAVEGGNQQAVVDAEDNTPTAQPTEDPKPVVVNPGEEAPAVVVKPVEGLIDEAFGVDVNTSKDNGIAEYKGGNSVTTYNVSGPTSVKVGETITLTCDNNSHWHSHNWAIQNSSNKVEFVGETNQNSVTVKGLKEGTATIYCGEWSSKQINVTDPQYVIRFYVSGTGTEKSYTENNKYGIEDQPNSTFADAVESNPLTLFVSPGYAILTDYNDTAKNITTSSFKNVSVSGDAAVREWLTTYANDGVPAGLTNRENVETIVAQVNAQYTTANAGYYKDQGITLPLLKTNFYNGFRFVGAHYVDSGESTIHVDVQLVKNTEYTVRYEPNGGAGNAYDDPNLYQTNDKVTVKNNMFTRAGYTFAGWNTEADGTGTSYQPDAEITIGTANVTLYAKWEEQKHTVTFDSKGGSSVDSQEVNHGATATEPTAPTKEGFVFQGWYTSDDATAAIYDFGTAVTRDITLYAKWEEQKHTVTFDSKGGSSVDSQEVNHGATATEPTAPTKEGFVFQGWYTSDDATAAIYDFGTAVTRDITLYAKWEELAPPVTDTYTLTIKYVYEDGKEAAKTYTQQLNQDATYKVESPKISSYVASMTTVEGTMPAQDTEVRVIYYLDNWKDADETSDEKDEDSATGGDGIPDCYQVLVNYKSGDTNRGSVGTLTMEVLTIKDKEKNVYLSEGQVTASGSTATATGSRNYFSNWTNDANVNTSNAPATLGQQVINAEGGKTYTFTANFGRSSGGGSSRPSTPVVDIPDDDVPTGLNGADHYAYIIGYGNNDVRPQNNITRAEVATIFFRLLTDDTREANMTKNQNYADVKDSNWFCRPVATLSAMNIIKGYEDGTFQPNGNITRAEFAAIAARFDPDGDTTPANFTDVAGHWAAKEISIAANHGWINGYEDGSFRPNQYITRAEAVTLINRVLNRLPETKDDLLPEMKTWVDNMDETAWYYLAIQEATNSHYNKNKEGTKYETWTELRENRDWSELEK